MIVKWVDLSDIWQLENEYLLHEKFQGIGFMKVHDFIAYDNKNKGKHAILAAYYPTDMKKIIEGENILSQKTKVKAMLELSLALAKMHEENYAHLDIKPDNIYLKWDVSSPENIEVGLGDFGEVKELTPKNFKQMDAWAGTPNYHSPERYSKVYRVLANNPKLSQEYFQMDLEALCKANDIYGLGKVFLEFSTGRMMTYDEGMAFSKSEVPQDPLQALAWNMMRLNPSERFTISDVLEHLSKLPF